MKVCIPTIDNGGPSARLAPHFGRSPFYTLVDTADGRVETVPNINLRREHGMCNPLVSLDGAGVEAVVTRRLGRSAFQQWRKQGVPVYVTAAPDVETALRGLETGELRRIG